ncbi:hypothetical protein Salat_0869300 [Sesamum alatum]|uniref:Uncharacterized protein n=1 Tax=Sesamum alatum TaxID=300844 RepID=A0AAE2CQS6_9LAMI|nr:hypothetical protein Salat_0869300 [Sesamum alatum]
MEGAEPLYPVTPSLPNTHRKDVRKGPNKPSKGATEQSVLEVLLRASIAKTTTFNPYSPIVKPSKAKDEPTHISLLHANYTRHEDETVSPTMKSHTISSSSATRSSFTNKMHSASHGSNITRICSSSHTPSAVKRDATLAHPQDSLVEK